MFARKEQLATLEAQGKAELQATILNRISDVYLTYYDLVQQQHVMASIDSAIVISNERVTTAQNRFSIGKASKLELLNAQVDLNTDKSLLLSQKEMYKNTWNENIIKSEYATACLTNSVRCGLLCVPKSPTL